MTRRLISICSGWLLGLAILSGCGGGDDGPKRYQVQGTVNFNGSPLESGRITFVPDSEKGNEGPVGYALIQKGQYDTSSPNSKSPVAGPVQILITGYDTTQIQGAESLPPLFEDYKQSAEIDPEKKTSTLDFDVVISKKK